MVLYVWVESSIFLDGCLGYLLGMLAPLLHRPELRFGNVIVGRKEVIVDNCGHVVVGVAVAYYSRRDRGIIDLCDVDTLTSVALLVEIDCVQNAAA